MVVSALGLWSPPADAFWEWERDEAAVSARGNIRLAGQSSDNPAPLSPSSFHFAVFRLMGDAWLGDALSLEFNAFQLLSATTADELGFAQALTTFGGVGRSDALSLTWSDEPGAAALFEVDRLFLQATLHPVDVRLGRQPLNLATTFLFTPNDVFEPFAAQAFFRLFKPGVDAARVDVALGELSQLSLIGVLGYDPQGLSDLDALAAPRLSRSALLLRGVTVVGDFEVSGLGGQLADRRLVGGGLQGELFEWLGVRAEGHVAFLEARDDVLVEATLELDHRFESTLDLRLAQFYHGAGVSDPDDYLSALAAGRDLGFYLGRHYTAIGAGYELTPLLQAQAVTLFNWGDPSALASVYLLYSVSDEAELALTGTLPVGAAPEFREVLGAQLPTALRSEFGLYPRSLGLDFRVTF